MRILSSDEQCTREMDRMLLTASRTKVSENPFNTRSFCSYQKYAVHGEVVQMMAYDT